MRTLTPEELKQALEDHKAWAASGGDKGRRADLQRADLQDADLRGAYLQDANLRGADLQGAYLQDANLRGADLQDANLRGAKTEPIRDDFYAVLTLAPHEVPGLYQALLDGRVDGSQYTGECACLVGTIANVRHVKIEELGDLKPDSNRPAERWFMAIRRGDTPENNAVSELTVDWLKDWCKEKGIALPIRRIVWETAP